MIMYSFSFPIFLLGSLQLEFNSIITTNVAPPEYSDMSKLISISIRSLSMPLMIIAFSF